MDPETPDDNPTPPPVDAAGRGALALWPDDVARVSIDDLVGTPEWLDELAALPVHVRLSRGLVFKVNEVTQGASVFRADFGSEVPTAAVLAQRFPRGGTFVVRASKRARGGRGGGNLTEVRIVVGSQDGAAIGGRNDALVERVVDAALAKMHGTPGATDPDGARRDDVPPAWLTAMLGRGVEALRPWLPKVGAVLKRFSSDEGTEALAVDGAVRTVRESGLLSAVAKWIENKVAPTPPAASTPAAK